MLPPGELLMKLPAWECAIVTHCPFPSFLPPLHFHFWVPRPGTCCLLPSPSLHPGALNTPWATCGAYQPLQQALFPLGAFIFQQLCRPPAESHVYHKGPL
jgi:hypothetical protein